MRNRHRNNIIYFSGSPFRYETFALGEEYLVGRRVCKFIKTTPKGFNFLDTHTSKCVFRRHLYDNKYSGKCIQNKEKTFKVRISGYMEVKPIAKEKRA